MTAMVKTPSSPACLPESAQNDPDLTLIVMSWEQLPAAVKTVRSGSFCAESGKHAGDEGALTIAIIP